MAVNLVINQRHLQIQLKQLETVWQTVINNFNLSQAAKTLYTSQSSLSKHIAALENQLKSEVFVRQGKRLVGLSPIGVQLLPHIEAIFAEVRTIENLALDFHNPLVGELSIATTHTQARYVLPWVVKQFKQRYPNVHLILQQADPDSIANMVAQGQADIGIATESLLSKDNLHCSRYYEWYHHIIVPQDHPLACYAPSKHKILDQIPLQQGTNRANLLDPHREIGIILEDTPDIDLATLAQYPIITYHGSFTGRSTIDKTFTQAGFTPNIVLTALDADVISTYVGLDMGIGIIAQMAFEGEHYRNLVKIPCKLFGKHTSWIATRADTETRSFGRAFIELCQQQFG